MKKHLSLILRIVLATLGIAYIAYNTDWINRVEVKPGTLLSSGRTVTATTPMRVVAGEVNPTRQRSPLTLLDAQNGNREVVVSADDLADAQHYLLLPSIITSIRYANFTLLLIGFLLVGTIYPLQTYRWLILMRCRGLEVTYSKAFKLTMIGCFFNYCMPGSTGGDVIKAFYAARRSDRRADSVMSVLFDRVTGLLGLVALGGVASLFMLHLPLTRSIAIYLWSGTAVVAVMSVAYFSRRLRQRLGVDWVLARLPGKALIAQVDGAAMAYGNHKGTVLAATLISIPVHLALTGATVISGFAVGMIVPVGLLMTVVPIIFLSGTFPITPQGAGVWEYLGRKMLNNPPAVTMNQIIAMLVMVRLYQLVYSLLGSAYLLGGDVHLHPAAEKVAAEVAVNDVDANAARESTV